MGWLRRFASGLLLAGVILSGLPAGSVAAAPSRQTAVRISYNTTVQGMITDTQFEALYEFEGQAGDVIVAEMTATGGDLDPLLGLLDPAGTLLLSSDDIDESNRNSRIEYYSLPADGLYRLSASRYNQANGQTTGAFSLTLTLVPEEGTGSATTTVETSVTYLPIDQNETTTGELSGGVPQYYLISGKAGDVIVAMVRAQGGSLRPRVRFLTLDLTRVSDNVNTDDGVASYFVLPQPGDYLIEVTNRSGEGPYELETVGFSAQWLNYGDTVTGEVQPRMPNNWYVFSARYGDTVTIEMTASDGDLIPYAILADVNLNDLITTTAGDNPARLTYDIPLTGNYVILASREGLADGTTSGAFSLRLNGALLDPRQLDAQPIGYGRSLEGTISDAAPVTYFSFQGKRGELCTLTMAPAAPDALDTSLELFDGEFTSLTASDNVGTSNTARIFQYQLPASGMYYILASRSGLAEGDGEGAFSLALLVGEVQLTAGAVAATLRWEHEADLDLFVMDPNGDYVAWDVPVSPSGGILELDTNSNCESVTSLPVEHVYWPQGTDLPGTYRFVVWYQLDCESRGPVRFELTINAGGREVARVSDTLALNERYEMSITLGEDGSARSNNDGQIVPAEADHDTTPIAYGQTVTGTLNTDTPFAYFEFQGQAGDMIEAIEETTSGDLDPYLGLADASEIVLIEDDDSAGNRHARVTVPLTETGIYPLIATRYQFADGQTAGEFRLTLNKTN